MILSPHGVGDEVGAGVEVARTVFWDVVSVAVAVDLDSLGDDVAAGVLDGVGGDDRLPATRAWRPHPASHASPARKIRIALNIKIDLFVGIRFLHGLSYV